VHYYYIPITRVEGWDGHVVWLKLPHEEVEKKLPHRQTSGSKQSVRSDSKPVLQSEATKTFVSFMRYTIWNGGRAQQPRYVKPLDKHFLSYNEDRAVSMLKDFVCNTSYEQLFEFRLTSCSHYNKIHFVLSCVVNYHFCF
jgi:hypothetical protein